MELAIDTSSETAGVALAERGAVAAEHTWLTARNHTVELVPAVVKLLERAGAGFQSLTGIVVARGPGSYNGLRAGISAAKGFAFALGLPLVGVSTLEVEAYPFAFTGLPICAVHDAGRGEIAVAFFRQDGEWRRLNDEHLTTAGALCDAVREKTVFCGEISDGVCLQLGERLGEKAVIPPPVARLRRAGYLASLGWARLEKGDADSVAALQPIYLRGPHITQPKKREV